MAGSCGAVADDCGRGTGPADSLILAGHAYDPEDGALGDLALVWGSDLDGQLGTGALLTMAAQDLTPGWHQLTLKPTDHDGMIGSASASIFVGPRVHLPLVLKQYGP
jgi:hypothetical protein